MPVIDVLVPVLNRPANAARVANSLRDSTTAAELLFVCSPRDEAEIDACRMVAETLVVGWEPGPGDYARKIQFGYDNTDEPLVLLAADDLRFRPGWLEAVLAAAEYDAGVIGTNDLANPSVLRG